MRRALPFLFVLGLAGAAMAADPVHYNSPQGIPVPASAARPLPVTTGAAVVQVDQNDTVPVRLGDTISVTAVIPETVTIRAGETLPVSGTIAVAFPETTYVDARDTLPVEGSLSVTFPETQNVAALDTLPIEGSVTAAVLGAVVVTDTTGTLGVDDGGGSLTVDGTVGVSGTVLVNDADTLAVRLAETSAVSGRVFVADVEDTILVDVNDTVNVRATVIAGETLPVRLSSTETIPVRVASSETLTVDVNDTVQVRGTVFAGDTFPVRLGETVPVQGTVVAGDTFPARISTSETYLVDVNDTVSIRGTVVAGDTFPTTALVSGSVSVGNTVAVQGNVLVLDTAVVDVNDTVQVRGDVAVVGAVYDTAASAAQTRTTTTADTGATLDVTAAPVRTFAVQVVGTGDTPTSWTVVLEGSLDGTIFRPLATHATADGNGAVVYVVDRPVRYFRSRVAELTLGSATNIVVTILGVE